jgi:hypothetical protein
VQLEQRVYYLERDRLSIVSYADPNKQNILQPRPILSKVSYRVEIQQRNHKRRHCNKPDIAIPPRLNNAVNPLRNEVAEDAESD